MPVSLTHFGLAEMLRWGIDLRRLASGAATLEEAAQSVVRYLYQEAVSPAGARECALVRFYATHPYGTLPAGLQSFARTQLQGERPHPEMQCLVLLGTAGERPEWNTRQLSRSHQAIPLPSVRGVERAPMVNQLLRGLGADLGAVVAPRPELVRGMAAKTYDVFHVAEAEGSPHIPDQGFVREHGIRSVLGFGGSLLRGGLFTVLLFVRTPLPEGAPDRFRNIALDLKVALAELGPDRVFAPLPVGVA